MKEATGELNMTVIVVIAVAAIAALFGTVIMPMISDSIARQTCEQGGGTYNATTDTCT